MVRKILLKFFEEFNKSSNNNEIKFANMMNFLVNLLVVFFIIVIFTSLGVPIGNIFAEAFNMFSHLLAQFPNDTCYFENNILLFEPNICEKKNKAINNEKKEKPIRHIKILSGAIFVTVLIIIYLLIKINKMKKNQKN
jgi:predicted permease